MIFRLIEYLGLIILVFGVMTQIVIPLFRNTPLLPFFILSREKKLEEKLRNARTKRREDKIREEIDKERMLTFEEERAKIDHLIEKEKEK